MKKLISTMIILSILLVGVYFVFGTSKQSTTGNITGGVTNDGDDNTKLINIKTSRWSYEPETITVKKGDHVKIIINNTDTTHGIVIPELGVSGIESVEFTADKPGTYAFNCPTMCGAGHKDMKGTLIVE